MKIARQKTDKEHFNINRKKNPIKFTKKKTSKENRNARRRGDIEKTIRQKGRARALFWTSIALIILASLTLLFIPKAGRELLEGRKSTALIIAVLFWMLEAGAYLIQGLISRTIKKAAFKKESKRPAGKKFNLKSIMAFSAAALALVGLIIPIALGVKNGTLIALSAALFISALQAGICLNSKNYISI